MPAPGLKSNLHRRGSRNGWRLALLVPSRHVHYAAVASLGARRFGVHGCFCMARGLGCGWAVRTRPRAVHHHAAKFCLHAQRQKWSGSRCLHGHRIWLQKQMRDLVSAAGRQVAAAKRDESHSRLTAHTYVTWIIRAAVTAMAMICGNSQSRCTRKLSKPFPIWKASTPLLHGYVGCQRYLYHWYHSSDQLPAFRCHHRLRP